MGIFWLSWVLGLSLLVGLGCSDLIVVILWMEVTLFTFIFMLYTHKLLTYSSPSIKYFLVQTIGSMILLLFALSGYMLVVPGTWSKVIMLFGLSMKLGTFPVHFWVVPTTMELPFSMVGILGVPMKILPLSVFYSVVNNNMTKEFWMIVLCLGVGSMLMGVFLGLKNNTLRGVLGASSITHSGWFFFALVSLDMIAYFVLYSLTLLLLIGSLIMYENGIISLSLYALSGLPPFALFFGKMMVLLNLFKMCAPMLFMFYALLSAVLSLYYYLKYSFMFFLMMKQITKVSYVVSLLFMLNLLVMYEFMAYFLWPSSH